MKYLVSSLIVIIIFLAVALSYYVGRSAGNSRQSAATATGVPTLTSGPTETPEPTEVPGKKVKGGGILSFPKYELSIPDDWTDTRESNSANDEKIILKKGSYVISITQGGFGGAVCLFPGDADVEGPSARYDAFKDLTTKSGDKMRRSWTGEELKSKGYAICQNTQYGWGAPTLYGHISFTTPSVVDPLVLAEMDFILSSLMRI